MPTAVEISNMALLEIGEESITALADSTERARACNTAWPFVRRSVLGMHTWNYPTKRAQIDEDATAPVWDFATRYPLPADCIRLLEVDTAEDWRVEAGFLVTDAGGDDLSIRYIYDEDDPADFPPPLVDAIVLGMAYKIMYRLNANVAIRDRIERQWVAWVAECKSLDGQEQSDPELEDESWVTCRY